MHFVFRIAPVVALALAFNACSGGGGAAGSDGGSAGSAGTPGGGTPGGGSGDDAGSAVAVLTGPTLGDAKTPNDQLRRAIQVSLLPGSETGFTVVDAFVFAPSATFRAGYYSIIRVKNGTSATRCFLEARDYKVKSAAGAVLYQGTVNRIAGTSGKTPDASKVYGDCLRPGAVGAFYDVHSNVPVDDVSTAEMTLEGNALESEPRAQLTPVSFARAGDDVSVTFENRGTTPALYDGGIGVVLDDALTPLQFFFLSSRTAATPIAPGAKVTGEGQLFFDGSATRLAVYTTIRDP